MKRRDRRIAMEPATTCQPRSGHLLNQPTRWSLVGRASGRWGDDARGAALNQWFADYAAPIRSWFLQERRFAGDGEDIAQAFMQHLIESDWFARADATRGSLRSFLLGTMRNFLRNWIRASRSIASGGGVEHVPFDEADDAVADAFQDGDAPDLLFHRQWALSVLREALQAMEQSWAARGKGHRFHQLRPRLFPEGSHSAEGAIPPAERQAIVRARRELGRWLRAIIARDIGTDDAEAIRGELQSLRAAL